MDITTSASARPKRARRRIAVAVAVLSTIGGAALFAGAGSADGSNVPTRPLEVNQTDGYGDGDLLGFTYFQNFDCVHNPLGDLDQDGENAAVDPDEFQSPHCVIGKTSQFDPAGEAGSETEPLYVIVPLFDADNDDQAVGGLAPTLRSIFGIVPDAFDPSPGVPVQCAEPGLPLTKLKGEFGTCTMHPMTIDVGPVLEALGKNPSGAVVNVPLPNHSHVIDGKNFGAIWWRIEVVFVTDKAMWPNVAGTRGINSVDRMDAAIKAGKALGPITSNFYLFFDSRELAH
jgi:hypothetical protein